MKKKLLLLPLILVLAGCAIGPLMNHETARSVGDGKSELIGGYGLAGYIAKWNYGVTENLDLGVQVEAFSVGLRMKYAIINQHEKGWSFALAYGTGASIGGNHHYAELLTSRLSGSWEPYLTFRYTNVKTDPLDFRDEDTGDVVFTVNSVHYSYWNGILGNRYWFNKNLFISTEVGTLFGGSTGIDLESSMLLSAALGYRF